MPPKAEKKGGARRKGKGRKIKLCKSSSQYEEKQKEEVLKTAMVMSLAVPDPVNNSLYNHQKQAIESQKHTENEHDADESNCYLNFLKV